MARTGVVTDPLYIKHDPGYGHPESPERLRAITDRMAQAGLFERTQAVMPRPATKEEITRVHAAEYHQKLTATRGRPAMLDPDTSTSEDSVDAALLAAGGTLVLAEELLAGRIDNGYALVRPPGHHAERSRAMGFCLFNNVAIAAEHALKALSARKVAIVDWDLHHGNGTQHSFYQRADVLYMSTHQYPYYPGTGALEEVGSGPGEGATVNVPLFVGMGDREYRAIFREIFVPILSQFAPDLLLVSTGFDTYHRDPLGGMRMTAPGYSALTWELMQVLGGKLILVLEGGYDLEGLSQGVEHCLDTLLGQSEPAPFDGDPGMAGTIIQAVRKVQSRFWKLA